VQVLLELKQALHLFLGQLADRDAGGPGHHLGDVLDADLGEGAVGRPPSLRSLRPPAPNDHPVVAALLYAAGGAALAAGTLALDRWLGPNQTPSWLGRPDDAEPLSTRQQLARRKSLFGQPSREPPELVKPTA
jgi:hypothetical protein